MSKLSEVAKALTSERTATWSQMTGAERLEAVKAFYRERNIALPTSITVVTRKPARLLTKDETIAIMAAALNGDEDARKNYELTKDPAAMIIIAKDCKPFGLAAAAFGPDVVAAKMIDALSVSQNEEFHKIRKFRVPATVAISAIPAFIAELQKLQAAEEAFEKKSEL